MKKIIGILAALMMCFTLSSCITPAQAQIDGVYDGVSVDVVIGYGTPIYNAEGLLMYYIYRDLYIILTYIIIGITFIDTIDQFQETSIDTISHITVMEDIIHHITEVQTDIQV